MRRPQPNWISTQESLLQGVILEMKHDALKKPWLWAALILALAFGLKLWLELSGSLPFNADEAVVALMGRHILQGARPLFFYGQAYMGSLDAILVALGFSFFGQHVWVIRLVQALSVCRCLIDHRLDWASAFFIRGQLACWQCCCWRCRR